jgi:hypothetical protein
MGMKRCKHKLRTRTYDVSLCRSRSASKEGMKLLKRIEFEQAKKKKE